MLYLLEDGENYKVGYSKNEETLDKRLRSYNTHNKTYKFLGIREGDKEDEKEYHQLLNCSKNSEWSCNIDPDILEKIKLDFQLESYLPSLFGGNIEKYEEGIPEPYDMLDIVISNLVDKFALISLILCSDGWYIVSKHGKYKVVQNNLVIETFYQDYDPEYEEKYSGFCVNKVVFYNFQIKGWPLDKFSHFTEKGGHLYKKLKPIMKVFKIK